MLLSAARSAAARDELVCSSLCWAWPEPAAPALSGLGGGTGRGPSRGASLGPENASWVQATDTGLGAAPAETKRLTCDSTGEDTSPANSAWSLQALPPTCSGHLEESSRGRWGLRLPVPPTDCRVLQSRPRAGGRGGLGWGAGKKRGWSSLRWKAVRVRLRRAGRSQGGLSGGLGGHGDRGAGHGTGHSEGQQRRLQWLSLPAPGPPLHSV